jgi:hypothetical protein
MNDITYIPRKERTRLYYFWIDVKYYYWLVINALTKYGASHPEYGTYSDRDLADMRYQNEKAKKNWNK